MEYMGYLQITHGYFLILYFRLNLFLGFLLFFKKNFFLLQFVIFMSEYLRFIVNPLTYPPLISFEKVRFSTSAVLFALFLFSFLLFYHLTFVILPSSCLHGVNSSV